MLFIRLLFESFRFAWNALTQNLLRTILSLTGVTIGIFAIIAALTVVDSLKANIKDSLSFLGSDILYVQKWPFVGSPTMPWWDYMKRPQVTFSEFRYLENKLTKKSSICFFSVVGGRTIKRKSSSIGGINIWGVTEKHIDSYEINIIDGRYFSDREFSYAANAAIIGHKLKTTLFPNISPIGKEIKVKGLK